MFVCFLSPKQPANFRIRTGSRALAGRTDNLVLPGPGTVAATVPDARGLDDKIDKATDQLVAEG
jgi:hypothetical protein